MTCPNAIPCRLLFFCPGDEEDAAADMVFPSDEVGDTSAGVSPRSNEVGAARRGSESRDGTLFRVCCPDGPIAVATEVDDVPGSTSEARPRMVGSRSLSREGASFEPFEVAGGGDGKSETNEGTAENLPGSKGDNGDVGKRGEDTVELDAIRPSWSRANVIAGPESAESR